ncbi:helix-turn-helix transcriptional regulator [Caedibacter taeniospiralis]|uniref:helix-turn-helix transcriptional regulator n=1 Tax=Caedibacter taeniospiralis TaxID=28907 RepID=UPI000C2747E4|nr:AlpA family phage regulatory protein [Caedibacter taeniospiralis]
MSFENSFRELIAAEIMPLSQKLARQNQLIELMADKLQRLETARGTTGLKKELLSLRDVEKIIGRKQCWIYKQMNAKEFPANLSMGSRVFWKREDIERFVEMTKSGEVYQASNRTTED